MSTYNHILVEQHGRVGYITLHRPDALNALNNSLLLELAQAVQIYDEAHDIGAIVLTGSERAFAAGADIKEMSHKHYSDVVLTEVFPGISSLTQARTPLIAAVSGFALGGGCELAMMCDIILAAENAQFAQPEIKLGVIPGIGGTQRLPRAIGKYKAAELIFTGRTMGAVEAERAGLVSRVVPTDELLNEATQLAEQIASMSLPVLYAAKEALQAAQETSLQEGLRLENRVFSSTFALDDQTEGMTAFSEKRAARFRHR